jgi:rhodanese-related sulfurtransferase
MSIQTTTAQTIDLPTVTAAELNDSLQSGDEIALVDLRETGQYASGHPVLAVSISFRDLETRVVQLVPRRSTPTVIYDDGSGFVDRALNILTELGYNDVAVLQGGLASWTAAGFGVVDGVGVISKALGEFVAEHEQTPKIGVDELAALRDAGTDLVLVDTRPRDEFARESIPGGFDAPGAELLYRIHDAIDSDETLIVVNCAGRTRGIIGAQALRNAGVANPVVALENGTAAWQVAGYDIASGRDEPLSPPSPEGLAWAKTAAARLGHRFELTSIDRDQLERLRREAYRRTTFVFDVRTAEEFEAGHLRGARSAPGGQLVQGRDEFIGTLHGRVVLVDDPDGVRATVTASWLVQIGLDEVFVYAEPLEPDDLEAGPVEVPLSIDDDRTVLLSPEEVAERGGNIAVFDIGTSRRYEVAHVPGARWVARQHLGEAIAGLSSAIQVVVISDDGRAAHYAAAELSRTLARPIAVLDGGTDGWELAGLALGAENGEWLSAPEDAWVHYRDVEERRVWLEGYTAWAEGVVKQLEAEGSHHFRTFQSE